MNNKGYISIFLVLTLLIVSIISSEINYKSNCLIEIMTDYKASFINFYKMEADLRKLFYNDDKFNNILEEKLRKSLYKKKAEFKVKYEDYILNAKILEDKTMKIIGFKDGINFESKFKILNPVYMKDDGYINYTNFDEKDLNVFFQDLSIIDNYNLKNKENYIVNEKEYLDYNLMSYDGINLIINNNNLCLTNENDSKMYSGVLIVNGDLFISCDFYFRGLIIINGGKLIIEDENTLYLNGTVVTSNYDIKPENLVTNYEFTNMIIYGCYLNNYIEKKNIYLKLY